jgi:osmotically-inducible protein OsmY
VKTLVLMFALSVAGCSSFGRCTAAACAHDAKITADVYRLLAEQPALGAPGQLQVQTIDRVVYLYGLVDTDLDRLNAVAIAFQAPNVKDVVESLGVRGNSR